MQLIFLDDVQVVDVLEGDKVQGLQDVTKYTEQIAHIPQNQPTQVAVVWAYCYYRVPITRISFDPEFRTYSSTAEPLPTCANLKTLTDPITGKAIGVCFDVTASHVGSWVTNVQVECTYFDEQLGREFTHRRTASFWISSQREIGELLDEIKAQ